MGLSAYVRAIAVRWVWLLVAGLLGLLGAGGLSALTPPVYAAEAGLFVGAARVDGDDGTAYAARIRDEVVPSVAQLARSGDVHEEAVARLDLPVATSELAARVTVAVTDETGLVDITVADADPVRAARTADAVAAAVVSRSAELLSGPAGPLLEVRLVRPAVVPRFPDGPGTLRSAVAGAAAGGGLAAVAAGLAELARPRIRGRRDVAEATSLPVLATLPPSRHAERAERLAALRAQLTTAGEADGRVALVDAGPGEGGAAALADELTAQPVVRALPGAPVVEVAVPGAIDPTTTGGVLLVADGRGTTREHLAQAVETIRSTGVPLVGVVVDGVLPSRASWAERLRAGIRGDAAEWLEERLPERRSDAGAASSSARVVAALAVAALGFTRPLPMSVTTGLLAVVALLPVWAPVVRRYRGAPLLMALTGLGLISGFLLAWLSSSDHQFARYEAASTAILVVTLAGGTGLLLWARSVLPLPVLGVAYGLGALAAGVLAAPGSDSAWKFHLSFPITVIALAVLSGRRRPTVPVVVVLGLGLVNVLNDARSAFAFTLMAAALMLWQARRRNHRAPGLQLAALGALALAGYWVLRELLLAGVLGSGLRERTVTQIEQSGSLVLGGRPEWTATWALMRDEPLGFGLGTVPSAHDVLVARQGISVTRIPTVEGYLENYLLAGRFELHSIVADLWSNLGPVGVVLGLVVGALVAWGLASRLALRRAPALLCYLAPLALWSLAFGPLESDLPQLLLSLGLLLPRLTGREPVEEADGVRDPVPGGAADAVAVLPR